MRFALDELVAALSAAVEIPPGTSVGVTDGTGVEARPVDGPAIDGLAIDSRELVPGQLFAAVRGERDGHDFVAAAAGAGAAAAMVERRVDVPVPQLVVGDVAAALADLARVARARVPGHVVGITGSVGKTTTKDLLAAVLAERWRTAASVRSFNNELGVPLTLCNAADDVESVVVEMGARGLGHIALLCSMAAPTVGVVTTVQAVHTELMGGLEDIAVAKGELVESLPSTGLAVLNAEVDLVAAMASRTSAQVLTFGAGGDVVAEDVRIDADLRPTFRLVTPWGNAEVQLGIRGRHNVANALAAAAVGSWAGVPVEQVADGLARGDASPWRMELATAPGGARILNDAYNAGPASTVAALEALASLPARRRVAVLGVMAELGDLERPEHRRVAAVARDLGLELVAVGTDLYGVAPLEGVEAVLDSLGELGPDDAVLVKGSRVAGLERVAAALVGRDGFAGGRRPA